MLRKIVTAVIVVPLAVIIVAFAVANRQSVTVSFDPFSATAPAYAATLPLFILIFVLVILGVIVGGIAAWLRQSKWRRTARKLETDVRALHQEIDALRHRLAAEQPAPGRAPASPYPVIPPPTA
ncbi:MAG TPA: LapA family protein [Pseudolabrys sp.]|jgi:uncharacterized integral membrane protein